MKNELTYIKDYAKIDTSNKQSLFIPIIEGMAFSSVVIMCVVIYFVLAV